MCVKTAIKSSPCLRCVRLRERAFVSLSKSPEPWRQRKPQNCQREGNNCVLRSRSSPCGKVCETLAATISHIETNRSVVLRTWALQISSILPEETWEFSSHILVTVIKTSAWLGYSWYIAHLGATSWYKPAVCYVNSRDLNLRFYSKVYKCSLTRFRAGSMHESSVSHSYCSIIP